MRHHAVRHDTTEHDTTEHDTQHAGRAEAGLTREGAAVGEVPAAAAQRVVAARITERALDPQAAQDAAWHHRAGAVVVFSGIVRNHDTGRAVRRLSYTAHPSAQHRLRQVAEQVAQQHPRVRIWAGHRLGELEVGDHALVAAAASAHRAEAFEACAELVEAIKAETPIWKEQFFDDGTSEWVGL